MEKSVIIPIGPPSCGKSTWYESFRETFKGTCVVVNKDNIRKQLTGDELDISQEDQVRNIALAQLANFLSLNMDAIYWDCIAPTYKSRRPIIELARKANYKVFGIWFDISPDNCKIMNKNRQIPVLESVIDEVHELIKLEEPDHSEGFDEILLIKD
jgi:predicted kinase